ncbi:hypothetical protein M2360_002387 [Rhizobium sp. SG_E_25_P2]|uniref:hypothetical protein n=1 Tax=Rhizobium sp. SG_E_25_P2 TaxID=2879942 RepID=UPI0024738EA1|nr:hypothetical protein [Rhizobium sp. SG_E_25_P2]MDH6266990.1 hypothetical protein [Rhizobium sp. SG_E_25_P2]
MARKAITVKPDADGRVVLGALAAGVSSYKVSKRADGSLLLQPDPAIPPHEAWLRKNPTAMAQIERGLADAKAGRLTKAPDFSSFLEEVDE